VDLVAVAEVIVVASLELAVAQVVMGRQSQELHLVMVAQEL
jgi:hypothetical protein